MKGHNLMQAIARVNRFYKDKPGGLVVDYIGMASDLKQALATYTESGGQGEPTLDIDAAVRAMREKYEVVDQLFSINGADFNYRRYLDTDTSEKLTIILEAEEFILGLEDSKKRFTKEVSLLARAFALAVPDDRAMAIKDELAFFQAVKARLSKFERNEGKSQEEVSAIRQLVDEAADSRGDSLGMTEDELALYDALEVNDSAAKVLGDEQLREIARELVEKVKKNATIDWTVKESVRAKLKVIVKRILRKYGYPPDKQLAATETILKQAELLADVWAV